VGRGEKQREREKKRRKKKKKKMLISLDEQAQGVKGNGPEWRDQWDLQKA
jgi:hypothetical protein